MALENIIRLVSRMTDRARVIKGLECCTFILGKRKCNECPYLPDNGCYQLQDDFHALLKKQEPILLENQHKPYGISTNANSPWISRCPRCGKKVEGKQTRFCKYCGQEVKWK